MPHDFPILPEFTSWPTFPFEGDLRVRDLDPATSEEPPRQGEDPATCAACLTPDSSYLWVSARWRVRSLDRPTGLPMVLILESRSHLDLGDLPNLLAAELGVMTVRLERAVRSLDGVARVHVNRWGDGSAHLHLWFLARPFGRLQLRGTFLSLWDDILPPVPEAQWRENLAYVGAWLAEFGGRSMVEAPHIDWQAPSSVDGSDQDHQADGHEELSSEPDFDIAAREPERRATLQAVEAPPGELVSGSNRAATSSEHEPPAAAGGRSAIAEAEVGQSSAGEDRSLVAGLRSGDSDPANAAVAGIADASGRVDAAARPNSGSTVVPTWVPDGLVDDALDAGPESHSPSRSVDPSTGGDAGTGAATDTSPGIHAAASTATPPVPPKAPAKAPRKAASPRKAATPRKAASPRKATAKKATAAVGDGIEAIVPPAPEPSAVSSPEAEERTVIVPLLPPDPGDPDEQWLGDGRTVRLPSAGEDTDGPAVR